MKLSSTFIFLLSLLLLSNLPVRQSAPLGNLGDVANKVVKEALQKFEGLDLKSFPGTIECDVCKLIVGTIQKLFGNGLSWNEIADAIGDMCYLFKLQDKNVCSKITHEFQNEVLSVFKDVVLSPSELCGGYLGKSCGSDYNPWNQSWSILVPGNKPPVHKVPAPKEGAPVIRILQLTDLHYDPLYMPGLSNQCGEPLCCRPPNAKANGSSAAGYWGDYNCDIPYSLLENLMQHLKSISDEFDWIYVTGDFPPHDVWETSRTESINIATEVVNLFRKYLPDKIVFPTYGNHEGVPVNSFPPPFITDPDSSFDWLSKPMTNLWSYWLERLPDWPDAKKTLEWGGYYNMKVREGLRVISLQTNYCNNENYWLLMNSTDPAGQLGWLINQLLEAETNGEKVHIIGHIPPGSGDCLFWWSTAYHKIVNRFESTIVGQFMGHAHTDWFTVGYDDVNRTRATNVLYVSPSVTTYQNQNPGFRIYTIDGEYNGTTYATIDHDTYYFDLNEANEKNTTKWQFEYSAKQVFGLKSLQPEEWSNLVDRLLASDDLFHKFYTYYFKSKGSPSCDTSCKYSTLCSLLVTVSGDLSHCKNKLKSLHSKVTPEEIEAFRTANKHHC